MELNKWSLAERIGEWLLDYCDTNLDKQTDNEVCQRELLVIQATMGNINRIQDDNDKALKYYQAALKISEQLFKDYGETAEWLRDIFVSYYECASCYPEGTVENVELLNKAVMINQKRMLSYPQYAHQTRPEQQIIMKTSANKLTDPFHLQQVEAFER